MKRSWRPLLCIAVVICLAVPTLLGCGKKDAGETTTIVIGDLTDISGPAQNAMTPITWALKDYCDYVNDQGLIPNVELKVVSYDTKYDSSRFGLGYDWVKQQGAKVVFTGFPSVAETINARAKIDGIPVITSSSTTGLVDNPGAVFCLATLQRANVPAVLKWVYENDWEGTGPASIAMASWNVAPDPDIEKALEDYCQDHPTQYTLVGTSLVPAGTMTWSAEVSQFKDCDYIFFGSGGAVAPSTFISQYREGGGTGRILSTDTIIAYVDAVAAKAGWEGVDGTISAVNWGWWTYEADQIDLVIDLLLENHPTEGPTVMETCAAPALVGAHVAVELIRAAVAEIGDEPINSSALYDALQGVTLTLPGFSTVDYTVSREGARSIQIWKWSAAEEDLVLASNWIDCYE